MLLSSGDKLGPYEILAPVGAGGMGEVYQAGDTRLDRIVAIKVARLPIRTRSRISVIIFIPGTRMGRYVRSLSLRRIEFARGQLQITV